MQLSEHIADIQAGIRAGRFINEASVSQGIVLRLLQALDWPTFDTQVVWPEYSVSGRRVDYALCHPKNKPIVFVEVKQVGQSEGAERQLFEYAFHIGVPMAILTDGQEWHFFLPAEQGLYQERRVYKLDILERNIEESVIRLSRYLTFADVVSGKAIETARTDYRNVSRDRQIRTTLPLAWKKLIEEQDSLLLDLLADRVESLCGYRPDEEIVSMFLAKEAGIETPKRQEIQQQTLPVPTVTHTGDVMVRTSSRTQNREYGFILNGASHSAVNARDVMVQVFESFTERDSTFIERFAALPKHGRKRRYVAARPEELYPGRPDLAVDASYQLRSGWWIGTNASKAAIAKIIEMACEVAGVTFGSDLIVELNTGTEK